jgi:uncharacterized protein with von Willebrand factor type A (vWA) domain
MSASERLKAIQAKSLECHDGVDFDPKQSYKSMTVNEFSKNTAKIADTEKEYIFLIDRSGSMSGCIGLVVQAVQLFIQSLPFGSKFNVISYGSNFNLLFPELSVEYNEETLKQALHACSLFKADLGGTEIFEPLDHIFK